MTYPRIRLKVEVIGEPGPQMTRSVDIYQTLLREFDDEFAFQEQFVVLCLDQKHRIIGAKTVFVGSLTSSVVHPREVFRYVVQLPCAAIICVHNHPSGDPAPSQEDLAITHRLRESAELLGIRLLDHIIVGNERTGYYSFADTGTL